VEDVMQPWEKFVFATLVAGWRKGLALFVHSVSRGVSCCWTM
jgi:hypothetical protein